MEQQRGIQSFLFLNPAHLCNIKQLHKITYFLILIKIHISKSDLSGGKRADDAFQPHVFIYQFGEIRKHKALCANRFPSALWHPWWYNSWTADNRKCFWKLSIRLCCLWIEIYRTSHINYEGCSLTQQWRDHPVGQSLWKESVHLVRARGIMWRSPGYSYLTSQGQMAFAVTKLFSVLKHLSFWFHISLEIHVRKKTETLPHPLC